MTPEQERAEFEAWAMYKADLQKGPAGEYVDIFARVMLDAWRARAALKTDWQTLKTAPKDGRTLLLGYFNSNCSWRTVRGQWISQDYIDNYFEDDWADADPGWYETVVESDSLPNCWLIDPTHWMPIPPPPTKEQS